METIGDIAKQHKIHLKFYEKKGRAAYLIHDFTGAKYFLKLQPPCGSFLSKVVRKVCGGSLPFINEYLTNEKLLKSDGTSVLFPKMFAGSLGEFILFEYIECEDLDRRNQRKSISLWLEKHFLFFNSMQAAKNNNVIGRLIFNLLENPILRILRQVMASDLSLPEKISVYKVVGQFWLQQPRLKPVLLHNDLSFSNLMDDCSGGLLLIDFEDSVTEKKLVLTDIVDLLFDRDELLLRVSAVEDYWRNLSVKIDEDYNKLNFKVQIRLCILRHILNSIFNPDFTDLEKKKYYKFMREHIVDDDGYNIWFGFCSSGI